MMCACVCVYSYRVSIAMARHTGSQVESRGVRRMDILQKCGSIKQLQLAFRKIRDMCTPGRDFSQVQAELILPYCCGREYF